MIKLIETAAASHLGNPIQGHPSPFDPLNVSTYSILNILNTVLAILILLASIYFIWGIIKLIRAENKDGRREVIGQVAWSVVAMTILVSLWGLAYFINVATINQTKNTGEIGIDLEIEIPTFDFR